jgi:hypothetical protein
MRRRRSFLLVLATAALAACAANADDSAASTDAFTETDGIFGDDRVADALRGHLDRIPTTYAEAEALFGVGRKCARTDMNEIFVVEEAQTRNHGTVERSDHLMPRAVISGCNTPEHAMAEANDPSSGSFSLFVALFSDENVTNGDPMVVDHVETIALDRKTGLYNFYVFEGGSMQRVRLMPNNDVTTWTLAAGATTSTPATTADRKCNNCHVNMGPLMNEMHEPWTNWVSTRKTLPAEANLTGETKSIVSHPSFANELEKVMQAGIRVWVEGLPNVPGSGFAQQNIDKNQPKGTAGLLKSVFCQTELQYQSAFDVAPLELFVDPGAAQGAGLIPPIASSTQFPILMPIRSEMDHRIEIGLMKKHVIGPTTALAVRLFDEQNDIFSETRCDLLAKVTTVDDATIRTMLRDALAKIPAGPRHDYAHALLTDGTDPSTARAAYLADLEPRLAQAEGQLQTADGLVALKQISNAKKDAAVQMFSDPNFNPRPVLVKD